MTIAALVRVGPITLMPVRRCLGLPGRSCRVLIGENHSRCRACRRKKAAESFYHSPEWKRLRRAKRGEGNAACAICESTERLTLHHRQGRRRGGLDVLENLIWLCGTHHSQYEADLRGQRDTELRRLVDAL